MIKENVKYTAKPVFVFKGICPIMAKRINCYKTMEPMNNLVSKSKKELKNEISQYKNQIAALENLHGTSSSEKYDLQKYYQSEINIRRNQLNEYQMLPKSILDIPVEAEIITPNSI